ncbi:Peptidoglycan glycosyltransferase MrdB [Candidatus Bealeia paramacronuclearis]|uniref:Peptidoglycan glycosyltransferase MrdB n=1 Tax=Candidatus Bealeia paramacronuclearis TaxID=1921001 RepID=A0ABZ2C117_9PROT|nr:Peptidoglycan glycosyltransferase MrdB [Candidatus Bealeia paramacronuclearis]
MKITFASLGAILRFPPWGMILLITLISSIGFLTLYSAAGGDLYPWAAKQMIRYSAGFVIMVGLVYVPPRFWLDNAYLFYGISFVLLCVVEVIGFIGMGAQRWIDLYVFQLQPSELMKLALILTLARYFHMSEPEDILKIRNLITPLTMVMAPVLLVMKQPDLGTAIILLISAGVIFFLSGVRIWKFLIVLALISASVPILWSFLHDYQKNRVLIFLDPERDMLGKGYHIAQSKIALGSGGLWGKGFMQGTQSYLNFLPEKQTDSIFSMISEEFGFMGGLGLLSLYGLVLLYGLKVTLEQTTAFGRLVAQGLTMVFFFYLFINIAMVMGLLPVVGIPLPLISYGGTAMLTLLISFGILFSLDRHAQQKLPKQAMGYF